MRTVQSRIQACRVIEKMERQEEFSKKLGLVNLSKYRRNKKAGKEEVQNE